MGVRPPHSLRSRGRLSAVKRANKQFGLLPQERDEFYEPLDGPTQSGPLQGSGHRKFESKKKPASYEAGFSCLKPDDVLLSHGEAPHYHRR